MELQFDSIGRLLAPAIMTALIMGALYYALVAVREIKYGNMRGLLHLMVAVLFGVGHLILLTANSSGGYIRAMLDPPGFWHWLVALGAPALISLYFLFGITSLSNREMREAATRLALGIGLIGLLYFIGNTWAVDIRGFIILFWAALWFRLELRLAD
ncbi:MAG: hypothetical protein AB1744_13030 [Candidatus Zixiibacteriota bacterium]